MLQIYINHFKEEFIVQETEKIDKTGKNKNKKSMNLLKFTITGTKMNKNRQKL